MALPHGAFDVFDDLLARALGCLSHSPLLSGYDEKETLSYQIALFGPISADVRQWDFHRTLNTEGLPDGETVILVQLSDRTDLNMWWVIANGNSVDLCPTDPGHDVDVYLTATLENLIALWLGDVALREAVDAKTVFLDGPRHLTNTAQDWMAYSPLIGVKPAPSGR